MTDIRDAYVQTCSVLSRKGRPGLVIYGDRPRLTAADGYWHRNGDAIVDRNRDPRRAEIIRHRVVRKSTALGRSSAGSLASREGTRSADRAEDCAVSLGSAIVQKSGGQTRAESGVVVVYSRSSLTEAAPLESKNARTNYGPLGRLSCGRIWNSHFVAIRSQPNAGHGRHDWSAHTSSDNCCAHSVFDQVQSRVSSSEATFKSKVGH